MGIFQVRMFLVCMMLDHVFSDDARIQNFRNLFNSLAKNESKGIIQYNQDILREEVIQYQKDFNSMMKELQFERRRNQLNRNKREKTARVKPTGNSMAQDLKEITPEKLSAMSADELQDWLKKIEEHYVPKEAIKEHYVPKETIKEQYVPKETIKEQYVPKEAIKEQYVPKEEYIALKEDLELLASR